MGTGDKPPVLQVTQSELEIFAQRQLPHWTELSMDTKPDGSVEIIIQRRYP